MSRLSTGRQDLTPRITIMDILKRWVLKKTDSDLVNQLSNEMNISQITACVMVNRGVTNVKEANAFINPEFLDMKNPFLLKDMDTAVKRIRRAVDNNEKILIYGDKDVDGVTAVSVLYLTLKSLGNTPLWYIPSEEGYGLHKNIIEKYIREGLGLIITVDCGITSIEESIFAKENNLDLIITDHHEQSQAGLPDAVAVINPKRKDSGYPFNDLAGCAVSLKLCQALMMSYERHNDPKSPRITSFLQNHLDLIAIGTIGDIMPLSDENRIFVKHGLKSLNNTRKVGLKLLLQKFLPDNGHINTRTISFNIAPLLNACGRLGKAGLAVELLTTDSIPVAEKTLARIVDLNDQRRKLQSVNIEKFYENLPNQCDVEHDKILFITAEGIEHGVTGIVASKLVKKYNKPVVLLIIEEDEAIGACRSIDRFNILSVLEKCDDILVKYGGHQKAAGFTVKTCHIETLRNRINSIAEKELSLDVLVPSIEIDTEIKPSDAKIELINELARLEPYGNDNPCPVFLINKARVEGYSWLGSSKNHLKLKIHNDGTSLDGVVWNTKELYTSLLKTTDCIDMVVKLELNRWKDREYLQLNVLDMRSSL